jgi:AraC family transcriptional regulator, arabinose operon regulatory protein
MAVFIKNVRETIIIPNSCREVFLPISNEYSHILSGADVLAGGLSYLRKGYYVRRKGHGFNVLLFCTRGTGVVKTDEGVQDFKPGMLLINPAGVYVEYRPKHDKWDFFWFHLKDSFKWRKLKKDTNIFRQSRHADELGDAMRKFISESVSMEEHHGILVELYARLILSYLEREINADVSTTKLSRVWDTVNADLSKKWTLEELANLAGMSYISFARASKSIYGIPPMKFVTKLKVDRAKEMLLHRDYKVEAMAQLLGYENGSAFSTVFKRHTGLSPKTYRLKNQ